jgi:uncharacterized protein YdaU (DUF1376 family)
MAARLGLGEIDMSKADVWMPLYTRDYLTATATLSIEQSGAYLHMLMHSWSTGLPLPDDDVQLARICKVTPGKFARAIKPFVMAFFDLGNDGWTQKRLEKERHRALEKSDAARKSANAKWRKTLETTDANADASAMRIGCSSPSPSQRREEKKESNSPHIPPLAAMPPSVASAKPPPARLEFPPEKPPGKQTVDPKGHRLPDGWRMSESERLYAIEQGLNPQRAEECFRDYWHARAGKEARKVNWNLTWKTYCRSDIARREATGKPSIASPANNQFRLTGGF